MKVLTKKQPEKAKTLSLKEAKALFVLGNRLADLAEDILEERGEYSAEFLASLDRADADIKAGRVHRIQSINELVAR